MNPPNNISIETARRLAITKQHLAGPLPAGDSDGMLDLIHDLGYLQIDPTSAVARSHLIVLWSRLGNYDLRTLDRLMWEEGKLFEYYAHAASIVPTEDYQIHNLLMRTFAKGDSIWQKRVRKWIKDNSTLRSHVIKTLRERGPLPSRSIEDKSDKNWRSKGWTNERNVSRMLDFLLIKGEIMVAARSGGQKLWDLAERCLPDWTPRTTLSEYEIARHVTEKSLRALGVAPLRQIQQYFARKYYGNTEKVLSDLEREGVINRVEIDGLNQKKQSTWYIHCGDLPLVSEIESGHYSPRTTLLSPFDNLIWDRVRTKELFDFIMSLEIYVPKPKRKFGYYVLPILHGDKLIGRIDPKMDRENKRLVINSIHAETSSPKDGVTGRAIGSAIESLAEFLGAKEIAYPERVPNAWRNSLG